MGKLTFFGYVIDDGKEITDLESWSKFAEFLSLPSVAELQSHLESPNKEILAKNFKKYKRLRKIYKYVKKI